MRWIKHDTDANQDAKLQNVLLDYGDAKCMACKHEWNAVVPTGVFEFQCPNCELMKGAFNKSVDPDEDVFRCKCGCDLWLVTASGVYCGNCTNLVGYDELCD